MFLCDVIIKGTQTNTLSFIDVIKIESSSEGIHINIRYTFKNDISLLRTSNLKVLDKVSDKLIITTKFIKYLNKLESWINKHF